MSDHRNASVKCFAVAYSAVVAHDGFEEFAQRVRPMLVALARRLCGRGRIDPEDLAQEALVRALVHHAALSTQPEPVYRAWLCRALTNHFLDQCRRRRTELLEQERRDIRLVREDVESPDARGSGEMWERVSDEDLMQAIARLSNPRVREAFELHASGLRYRAIAQRMSVPEGTVGSWLFQARKELRELLSRMKGDDGDEGRS